MSVLLVGYKAGDLDEVFRRRAFEPGDAVVHELDVYHAHAVAKTHPGVKVVCTPHLPSGDWDVVLFRTGPKLMSGELSLDLLQEIHLLKPKRFELDFVGRERDRNDLLNKIKDDPGRVRNFAAVWPASVPGGEKMMFTSYPGCFCHRRLDEGGLALAEVVSRELESRIPHPPSLKILDMGCGCGLVGLLVAARLRNLQPQTFNLQPSTFNLTLIDSHTRAVEAATVNAKAFGIDAEIVLADDGLASVRQDPTYDVFVGNPPYYSDYRIAEVFLETARSTLRPGGVCYTVVKNDAGLRPVQKKFFPSVEVIRRRGYCVLKSVKE